jgi:hypothetical protein
MAVIMINKAEKINGMTDIPGLYENAFIQLLIKYQATGKAIAAAINASQK